MTVLYNCWTIWILGWEKWQFISKGCLKRAQIYRRWQCFTISWHRLKCSTWQNLTLKICCGAFHNLSPLYSS